MQRSRIARSHLGQEGTALRALAGTTSHIRYRSAREALGIKHINNGTMHAVDDAYLGLMTLDTVASVLGIPASELQRSIDAAPGALPVQIVTLRAPRGVIQRDAFDAIVAELVDSLGLGKQLVARRIRGANVNAGAAASRSGNAAR